MGACSSRKFEAVKFAAFAKAEFMFRLNFKAGIATASKNSAENYYMLGLADDKYDYKNYLLFQRPIKLERYEDADALHNGLYAKCRRRML